MGWTTYRVLSIVCAAHHLLCMFVQQILCAYLGNCRCSPTLWWVLRTNIHSNSQGATVVEKSRKSQILLFYSGCTWAVLCLLFVLLVFINELVIWLLGCFRRRWKKKRFHWGSHRPTSQPSIESLGNQRGHNVSKEVSASRNYVTAKVCGGAWCLQSPEKEECNGPSEWPTTL